MGAPSGNQFWKIRTKHGRDKLFSSPDILWEEACKYFTWCDENPLKAVEQVRGGRKGKKDIEISEDSIKVEDTGLIEIPLMRAYTWTGLEIYLGLSSLRKYKTNAEYKDFVQVIDAVGKIIYTQKFEGASAGLLNANIIARDLGLTDQQKHEHTGKVITVTVQDEPPAESKGDEG